MERRSLTIKIVHALLAKALPQGGELSCSSRPELVKLVKYSPGMLLKRQTPWWEARQSMDAQLAEALPLGGELCHVEANNINTLL